jgi:hypothetical protein
VNKPTPLSPRAAVALGLLIIAMGVFLVLFSVGLVPGAEASLEAPRWVGACAGLMFALCGGAMIVGYAVAGGVGPDGDLPEGTPWWVRLTQYLLGLGIIGAPAAIATWIAFGPGRRAFTVTLPFVGRGPGDETVGRVVFGIGAVLVWVFLVLFLVVSVQRLRRR